MDNDKQRNVESDEGIAKKRNCSLQEEMYDKARLWNATTRETCRMRM